MSLPQRSKQMRIRFCVFLGILLGCHCVSANTLYTVTDLGILEGTTGGQSLNDLGQATGSSNVSSGIFGSPAASPHAFLYSNGQMTDLGTLGGRTSVGFGINNAAHVTGAADTRAITSHAFLYSNGQMVDLGTLGGDFSEGRGINDAGQVAGTSMLFCTATERWSTWVLWAAMLVEAPVRTLTMSGK